MGTFNPYMKKLWNCIIAESLYTCTRLEPGKEDEYAETDEWKVPRWFPYNTLTAVQCQEDSEIETPCSFILQDNVVC